VVDRAERADLGDRALGGRRHPQGLVGAHHLLEGGELRPPRHGEATVGPAGSGPAEIGFEHADERRRLGFDDLDRRP